MEVHFNTANIQHSTWKPFWLCRCESPVHDHHHYGMENRMGRIWEMCALKTRRSCSFLL